MNQTPDIEVLFEKLVLGDRVALGQAITLIESRLVAHRPLANTLLDCCLSVSNSSFRFAVSGAPGVGKSSLIEILGQQIITEGHKLAILAIDPTSPVSHGAILGDKTRMDVLSRNPNVFIRPSSAGRTLGGVTDRTRETIALCEAAGYDHICIETVGVGQSETDAHQMTDFFLLLILPGGGDDLQGIKKGIVEMADLIAINKCDGVHVATAKQTQRHYAQAVHFHAQKPHGFTTRVVTCSAKEQNGIDEIWSVIKAFAQEMENSGYHQIRRAEQNVQWLESRVHQLTQSMILALPAVNDTYQSLRRAVRGQTLSVSSAIGQLEQVILNSINRQSGFE